MQRDPDCHVAIKGLLRERKNLEPERRDRNTRQGAKPGDVSAEGRSLRSSPSMGEPCTFGTPLSRADASGEWRQDEQQRALAAERISMSAAARNPAGADHGRARGVFRPLEQPDRAVST